MLTYVPIFLSQGMATRSAVRATPKTAVEAPVVHSSSPKLKTTLVFHLPKIKSEFMSRHRILCFGFSKSSPTHHSSAAVNPKNDCTTIAIDDPVTPKATYADHKRLNFKEKDKFLTPVDQIRSEILTSSRSEFSDITISTIHENFEEYKRQNSPSGFWSPTVPNKPQIFVESRSQSFLEANYSSLAEASRSKDAAFYEQQFRVRRFMLSPRDKILEDFVNNILANLAAMCPKLALELLSMRNALFADFIGAQAHEEKNTGFTEESGLVRSELRNIPNKAKIRVFDLKNHFELKEGLCQMAEGNSSDLERTRVFLEDVVELYRERTKMLRAEIEEKIDEALSERQEEAKRKKLAERKQKHLIDRIKNLEISLKKAQDVLQERQKKENQNQIGDVWLQSCSNSNFRISSQSFSVDSTNTFDKIREENSKEIDIFQEI